MWVLRDSFLNHFFENQGESADEKIDENDNRVHAARNSLRPKNARLSPSLGPDRQIRLPSFSPVLKTLETVVWNMHSLSCRYPIDFETFYKILTTGILDFEISHLLGIEDNEHRAYCQLFLSSRSFLFEKRKHALYYRNTGFGYRKTVVKITQFIHKMSHYPNRCTMKDLVEFCHQEIKSGGMEAYNDLWFDEKVEPQSWNDSYSFFKSVPIEQSLRKIIGKYPMIFWTMKWDDDKTVVGLKQEAFGIPSLWNEELLPKVPEELLGGGRVYDKSREELFIADIVSAYYGYTARIMEATIVVGRYRGRLVRIVDQYPMDRRQIPELMPIGTLVFVPAHLALGCNYEFCGVNPIPMKDREFCDSEEISKRICGEEVPGLPPASYAPLKDLIAAEKFLIEFIDHIFGDDILSFDEIVGRMKKRPKFDCELLFRNSPEVVSFIQERPHLYYYNGHRCWARSPVGRSINNALLGLLNVKKGKTMEQIQNALRTAPDDDDLQLIFEGGLKGHIHTVESLLKIKQSKGRTVYTLRSYFDKTEKMLLPGYPRNK